MLGLGLDICKMSLEHLIVTESKDVLTKLTTMGVCQRDTGAKRKRQRWNNLNNKINTECWIITQSIKSISMGPYLYE